MRVVVYTFEGEEVADVGVILPGAEQGFFGVGVELAFEALAGCGFELVLDGL